MIVYHDGWCTSERCKLQERTAEATQPLHIHKALHFLSTREAGLQRNGTAYVCFSGLARLSWTADDHALPPTTFPQLEGIKRSSHMSDKPSHAVNTRKRLAPYRYSRCSSRPTCIGRMKVSLQLHPKNADTSMEAEVAHAFHHVSSSP